MNILIILNIISQYCCFNCMFDQINVALVIQKKYVFAVNIVIEHYYISAYTSQHPML